MIKKVLIVVPHEDDELNIAGCLFEDLLENKIEVHVLFITRSDFYKKNYIKRKKEMESVMKIYGIKASHILDFPDSYRSENHIYNDPLSREKLKQNMKAVVVSINADLIVCVDFDSHPDHIMCSQLFDQLMSELFISSNYRPIVLKKFSYLGVWGGKDDFFAPQKEVTHPSWKGVTDLTDLLCLPNSWDDRIRIATRKEDVSLKFWKSKLFKAYCSYLTQMGIFFYKRTVNADAVYWYRNTRNLAIGSEISISASSGKTKYLNDFSLAKVDKIRDHSFAAELFSESAWIPEEQDTQKEFVLSWQEDKTTVSSIKLYQNFKSEGHINTFVLELSNGFRREYTCGSGDVEHIVFEKQENISWLKFSIVSGVEKCGIREFEVFEDSGEFPWADVPFRQYQEDESSARQRRTFFRSWFMNCTGYITERLTRSGPFWGWPIGFNLSL